ncbi:hypothetical protein QQ045_010961 [Rhodiola kirilowii]
MASGFSGLLNPPTSSKAFDFQSDDVLCSYDEFCRESTNGVITDSATGKDFSKDFQKSRMTRYSTNGALINPPDETPYHEIFSMVEKCMKRHTDDIMRFLEGISSRLVHLELYCYNVDKSVGEMLLNMGRDYEETDSRLKSLEKHLGEVSQSVQILRDKQELAETQKELVKLQLAQKEFSSPNTPQHNIERSASPTSDYHKTDDTSELQNQHLAIVLHHQVPPQQQSPPTRRVEVPLPVASSSQVASWNTTQGQHYYVTSAPYQVQHVQTSQGQYLTSDTQYRTPQPVQQGINLVQLQPVPAQVSQAPHQMHQFVQYQQQLQQPQHMMSTQLSIQQPHTPVQSRPQSGSGFPHQPSQSLCQAPQESVSGNIHMNNSFSCMPQQMVTRSDAMPNGFGIRPVQQQPPPAQSRPQSASGYPHQPSQSLRQAPQESVSGNIHMNNSFSCMSQQVVARSDAIPNGFDTRPVQQQPPPHQIKSNFGSPNGDIYMSLGPHQSLSPANAYMMYGNQEVRKPPPPQSQFPQVTYPPAIVPLQHPQNAEEQRHIRNLSQSQFTHNDAYNVQTSGSYGGWTG